MLQLSMKLGLKTELWFQNLMGSSSLLEKVGIVASLWCLAFCAMAVDYNVTSLCCRPFLSCFSKSCENNEEGREGPLDSEATM